MANNILNSYIPKFLVNLNRKNEDVVTVTTNYLSSDGQNTYVLDKRTIAPILIQTTQSMQELRPEISNIYPYRYPTPIEYDGSTLLLSPSSDTVPTASQDYYVPVYFERYNRDVVQNIDRSFTEFTI